MTFPERRASLSPAETESLGEALAREIIDNGLPRFVALFGDLGVGKTAFVRGFTRAIAPDARVKSPTFALVNEYKGKTCSVFHFDMYRIEDEDELYSIGFYDYADRGGICITEWSENIEYALPESYIRVELIKDNESDTDSRAVLFDMIGA
ncbi:MAG: tRNA (adenosine(37)-N6)-threonylcarbamoyltransferase complex ATPase subunit type 1 TsaE [Ruminococcaceae bacterium]|nr:tRNA (adenosine(37)-N6)-threonylcarbamoyltransferase complex ATPase subunit type 1 TsaE [Oscillospiraceae bacterium]